MKSAWIDFYLCRDVFTAKRPSDLPSESETAFAVNQSWIDNRVVCIFYHDDYVHYRAGLCRVISMARHTGTTCHSSRRRRPPSWPRSVRAVSTCRAPRCRPPCSRPTSMAPAPALWQRIAICLHRRRLSPTRWWFRRQLRRSCRRLLNRPRSISTVSCELFLTWPFPGNYYFVTEFCC